jgi:hypothetical protein
MEARSVTLLLSALAGRCASKPAEPAPGSPARLVSASLTSLFSVGFRSISAKHLHCLSAAMIREVTPLFLPCRVTRVKAQILSTRDEREQNEIPRQEPAHQQ